MRLSPIPTRRSVPRRSTSLGRTRASRRASPIIVTDLVAGRTPAWADGPRELVKAWIEAGYPTCEVEKGYGSGIFQRCYVGSDGDLRTEPFDGGQLISTWAAGAKLLVSKRFNQGGSSPDIDYITASTDSRRVLLDVSIAGAPRYAGLLGGTQDASQHATERCYPMPAGLTLQTNHHPFSAICVYQHVAAEGGKVRILQDTVNGATAYWSLEADVKRHFPNWAIVVSAYDPTTVAQVNCLWALNNCRGIANDYSMRAGQGGVVKGGNNFASVSTSRTLNSFGPVNSMGGYCYALIIFTDEVPPSAMLSNGISKNLSRLFTKAVALDKPTINFPYVGQVIPMDLVTQTADIPIKLMGKPSTAYQASWQGGSYVGIGTTDATGFLAGALPAQAKGNGTLNIREVGGSTPISILNVAVGFVFVALGESNPDGRGVNVPLTIPTGSLRRQGVNWTTLNAYGTVADYPSMITAGGTGYTVNDVLTWPGGTGTAAQFKVTAVNGVGGVIGITGQNQGSYSVAPASPAAMIGGTGTGCQLNTTFSVGNQYWLAYLQAIYDIFGCVIDVTQVTQGSTYFYRPSPPGPWEGNWSTTPNVNVQPPLAATALTQALVKNCDFLTPNDVLFDLGANDASLLCTQAQWVTRANAFIQFMRDGLDNQNFQISMILTGENSTVPVSQTDAVRAGQLQNWAEGTYVPAGSFAHLHADAADNVHWSSLTVKNKIRDLLIRYKRHKWLGGAQARAHRFSSIAKTGPAQITVTFTGGVGNLTVGSISDVAGWSLSDGSGGLTITSVAIVGGNQIQLNLNRNWSGTVSTQWGSGSTSIGTTLLDSDATTPLPPEPFGPVTV